MARVVAIAGYDVPESHFERCQLYRRKVSQEHWRRRLARMPLEDRMQWAFMAYELAKTMPAAQAERLAWRSIEPEPKG
ncbi:MAG: hypothetical protein EBT79_12340 [Actinobacteria bacterium]|nr:hypothetical protein [Actinomycetota bacterium]